MVIRKKKKDEEEDSFASKLSTLGAALSTGGEEEAESTLESLATIVEGVADIHSAWSARTEKNRSKAGLENTTEGGEPIGKALENEYKNANETNPSSDSSDKSSFVEGKVSQLDPTNARHGVLTKAFKINQKNATRGEENSHYQIMLKKEAAKQEAKTTWLQETSNSPAAKAFEPNDPRRESWDNMRYEQHLTHTGQDTVDTDAAKIEENKLEKENAIIDKAEKITSSVDNIDGKLGDFVDPDDWKNKSLFGNMGRNV